MERNSWLIRGGMCQSKSASPGDTNAMMLVFAAISTTKNPSGSRKTVETSDETGGIARKCEEETGGTYR